MVVGFVLAARLPVWLTIVIAVAMELFVGYMIRDNLTLNVIMLLWPLQAIRELAGRRLRNERPAEGRAYNER